jgi:hypothetical protein
MRDGSIEEVPAYMPWGLPPGAPPVKFFPSEGREMVLQVKHHGHTAPHESCRCGIHLATDIWHALDYRGETSRDVVGLVKGWGTVIRGSQGFRVEFAYPERLYLFGRPEGEMDLTHYGVPLASILECEEWLAEQGLEKW